MIFGFRFTYLNLEFVVCEFALLSRFYSGVLTSGFECARSTDFLLTWS